MRGSHGLSARRARRTKSRMPEGQKAGPKGRQLEVGAQRAPRLLVPDICLLHHLCRWRKHLSCGEISEFYKEFEQFMEFLSKFLPFFVPICVEKNLAQKCLCGEKMTNMRSGLAFRLLSLFLSKNFCWQRSAEKFDRIHHLSISVQCKQGANISPREPQTDGCW